MNITAHDTEINASLVNMRKQSFSVSFLMVEEGNTSQYISAS